MPSDVRHLTQSAQDLNDGCSMLQFWKELGVGKPKRNYMQALPALVLPGVGSMHHAMHSSGSVPTRKSSCPAPCTAAPMGARASAFLCYAVPLPGVRVKRLVPHAVVLAPLS
jgi:hypothetical protein